MGGGGGGGGGSGGSERRRYATTIFIPCVFLLLPLVFYLQCSFTLSPSSPNGEINGGVSNRDGGLLHILSDEELFDKVALAEPRHVVSAKLKNPPKIALLFLTTGKLPFEQLWAKFVQGNEKFINIYVHADPFSFDLFPDRSSPFWGRIIPSRPTSRGSPSLIAATRRLLANALLDDPANSHFVLLSDRCIPIHGFRRLHKRLHASPRKSFMEITAESHLLHSRYESRGGQAWMHPEVDFGDFRIGSQWFVLTRSHAMMFVNDRKFWPKFRVPCANEFNCYPEEHYFPTVMAMLDPLGSHNVSLTRVEWPSDNTGHPTMFDASHVNRKFIQELQQDMGGRFMFARKFADGALEPLMALSDVILKH